MKRTPEEERIFRALAQIETPEADLSAALRRTEEPRRIRPVRPLAAAAVLCALLTIGAAAVLSEVNWPVVVSASVLAGCLSLLTSVAGLPEVEG